MRTGHLTVAFVVALAAFLGSNAVWDDTASSSSARARQLEDLAAASTAALPLLLAWLLLAAVTSRARGTTYEWNGLLAAVATTVACIAGLAWYQDPDEPLNIVVLIGAGSVVGGLAGSWAGGAFARFLAGGWIGPALGISLYLFAGAATAVVSSTACPVGVECATAGALATTASIALLATAQGCWFLTRMVRAVTDRDGDDPV